MSETGNRFLLAGCTPVPIAGYLKALGILRVVAEQKDPAACGWWENRYFVLRSSLNKEELLSFLLNEYKPSPIIAPWNGGSGFYPKDNRESIEAIRASTSRRFASLRGAIEFGHKVIEKDPDLQKLLQDIEKASEKKEIKALSDQLTKVRKEKKSWLLTKLRAGLPDAALDWIDATVVITAEEDLKYPPLLGSGGNDGRLDFTNNYMQCLGELLDVQSGKPKKNAASYLCNALFAEPVTDLLQRPIGQFSPGAAGGLNSSVGYEGKSGVNPWDFIFMLEGSLIFSGGLSRRLEAAGPNKSNLIYPFTVRAAGGGSGAIDTCDEGARGELWLPTWTKPSCLDDLNVLFREGRLSVGQRSARDGIDAVRAVSSLGADRRVDAFERYALLERNGKAYFATPLGSFRVKHNPQAELINDFEQWLQFFRRVSNSKEAPARLKTIRRNLDDGLFELAQREKAPAVIQRVLVSLGKAMSYLTTTRREKESISPLPLLRSKWVYDADDYSDEYRIAAALAGLCAMQFRPEFPHRNKLLPVRVHLADLDNSTALHRYPKWAGDASKHRAGEICLRMPTWGPRSLEENLVLIAQRRALIPTHDSSVNPWSSSGQVLADRASVSSFLMGNPLDDRIAALFKGLAYAHQSPDSRLTHRKRNRTGALPLAYAAIKPLMANRRILSETDERMQDIANQPACPGALLGLLASNRVSEAVQIAMGRMRASGFPAPFAHRKGGDGLFTGPRLLAALLIPVDGAVIKDCLNRIYPSENSQPGEQTDVT